jgi:hypothetical protein
LLAPAIFLQFGGRNSETTSIGLVHLNQEYVKVGLPIQESGSAVRFDPICAVPEMTGGLALLNSGIGTSVTLLPKIISMVRFESAINFEVGRSTDMPSILSVPFTQRGWPFGTESFAMPEELVLTP